jgi:hypothetical protein
MKVFGNYEAIEELASGPVSVFKGRDRILKRHALVKV